MGFVGDMLGGRGGGSSAKGGGFNATGVTQPQINTAYDQTQAGIKQQQDFVTALGGQGGLGNQSSVFNQQQGLANQLQGVANGTGPNPALAQLNQQTGRNVANQAALMASQRGANQNVGLMARQAAQQGANIQQQAAGQGATLQAQQQLAAMQQLGSQQANMANLANSQIGQQQTGLSALNQNSLQQQANLLGMQANINNANAGIAGVNTQGQQNMTGNIMGAVGSIGSLFGGSSGGGGSNPFSGMLDSMASSGIGSQGMVGEAEGGLISKQPTMYADGGPAYDPLITAPTPMTQVAQVNATQGPSSNVGKMFNDQGPSMPGRSGGAPSSGSKGPDMGKQLMGTAGNLIGGVIKNTALGEFTKGLGKFFGSIGTGVVSGAGQFAGGAADAVAGGSGTGLAPAITEMAPEAAMVAAKGGQVPALVSPGEQYLPPQDVKKVKKGANPLAVGERIPGKPKHPGNNYANDIVPKTLESGGIVIPNKVMQSKNPSKEAAKFVEAILAKKSLPKRPGK